MTEHTEDGRPVVLAPPAGGGRPAIPTRRPFGEVTAGPGAGAAGPSSDRPASEPSGPERPASEPSASEPPPSEPPASEPPVPEAPSSEASAPELRSVEPSRAGAPPAEPPTVAGPGPAEALLAERTADLQRLQAEYDNYRKRVRRDRLAVGEVAVTNVLARLLPVLDALDAAHEQGELTGGLAAVAELLEIQLASLGLQSVGEEGEPFDPACHEALARTRSLAVTVPTCAEILRHGYRVGGHLLRPAEVVVAEPPGG